MSGGGDASPQAMQQALDRLLGRPPLVAQSRKIFAATDSGDRFLWTFPRDWLPRRDDPDSLSALIGTAVPAEIRTHWQRADTIHIGFDGATRAGDKDIRKIYLEFSPPCAPEHGLVYLAAKCGDRDDIHRYDTLSDAGPVLDALALPPPLADPAAALARRSNHLLRVAERGTHRLSLDINLSDMAAEGELSAALADLVAQVNPDAPAPRCWPSHIALGRDRRGDVFVTLYGWPWEPCP